MTSELIDWFLENRREYPWRENQTPYRVWISEIMLQQTVVQVVAPRFVRWMKRWDTIERVAKSSETDVVREWEGLGYYSRARNIHRAANSIVDLYGGEMPDDLKKLKALPGIGDYTAGAILSIAFNLPQPAIDANVKRIFQRWHCWREWTRDNDHIARIQILEMMRHESPRRVTEAMMQLGQIVCLAKSPKCAECPVSFQCEAFACGAQDEIPSVKSKEITKLNSMLTLIVWERKLLLRQQPDGVMRGLWVMPRFSVEEQQNEATNLVDDFLNVNARQIGELTVRTHHYTHFAEKLTPIVFSVDYAIAPPDGWIWVDFADLGKLPFGSVYRKVVDDLLSGEEKVFLL